MPEGIIEDVLVRVGKFILPADFGVGSSNHQYFYLVNEQKQALVVYDLQKEYSYVMRRSEMDGNITKGSAEDFNVTVMRRGDIML